MAIDYISNLSYATDLCGRFRERVLGVYFDGGKTRVTKVFNFVLTEPYIRCFRPLKGCIELCRILNLQSFGEVEYEFYLAASSLRTPKAVVNLNDFELHLGMVVFGFQTIKDEASIICSAFDEEEKERMNEAIHAYLEDCSYSCVAMSVSAVESRLLKLMCLVNPESKQILDKKTLGQLIIEYNENRNEYKNVVPEKHEPLLKLSNTYRTFSVHPKKQKITPRLANSILSLALEFLIDEDTKPEVVQAKVIANKGDK